MNEDVTQPVNPPRIKAPILFTLVSALIFVLLGVVGIYFLNSQGGVVRESPEFLKFKSEEEFRNYLIASGSSSLQGFGGFATGVARDLAVSENLAPVAQEATKLDRVSETNVQVAGLDEPDIVKTDGNNIFFSSQNFFYPMRGITPSVEPLILEDTLEQKIAPTSILPPEYEQPDVKIIGALPPQSMAVNGTIDTNGDLLLSGNILMVFSYNKVTGFNVTDPKNPTQAWQHELDENYSYTTARLANGKVYLVATRYADVSLPCPIPVLRGNALTIACTDIYRPSGEVQADTMYSVIRLNPASGSVEDSVNFVGASRSSVVYMSPNAIYATFTSYPNTLNLMSDFFSQNTDLVTSEIANKISNLKNIDISNQSKLGELSIIIQNYLSGLSQDERARVESELTNRMNTYLKDHSRELQNTSIVKIDVTSLDVAAAGSVPGAPLNQFSLDEHEGNLRLATTLSASTMFGAAESESDLYVLNSDLSIRGRLTGLAAGERIYSARFIGNTAYLVTFKQIDPFFVIDLADPANPKVAGELKIPGFSSYLHPLTETKILGVGQEERQTKLSVFDVANPANPTETDKYVLNEFYSEVQNNHHAFLADNDHKVFFIPAGSSGYIFSYADKLALTKVVSDISAKRALYINNYLYIVGDQKVVVLDESNWQEVGSLPL